MRFFLFFSVPLLLLIFLPSTETAAYPPAAEQSSPAGLPLIEQKSKLGQIFIHLLNLLKDVLPKKGKFKLFIDLITLVQDAIQLADDVYTIFAPTDDAFNQSGVPVGMLANSTKIELTKSHIVPQFLPFSELQNVSTPLKTLGGLTIIVMAVNDTVVNISAGGISTIISKNGIVHIHDKKAVYQLEQVLFPLDSLAPSPSPSPAPSPSPSPSPTPLPSPAPAPSSMKPTIGEPEASPPLVAGGDRSGTVRFVGRGGMVVLGFGIVAAVFA